MYRGRLLRKSRHSKIFLKNNIRIITPLNYYHLHMSRGYSFGLRHGGKQNWWNIAVPFHLHSSWSFIVKMIWLDRNRNACSFFPTDALVFTIIYNKTERTVTLLDMSLKNVRQFFIVSFAFFPSFVRFYIKF